tara:strand:- start:6643 stop:6972 length:330 start_codon:yes stop_codon:yes gene_type:complete
MAVNGASDNSVLASFNVKGRNIVITGGCRGLGLSFAQSLAQCGANIAAIDLNDQASEEFSRISFGGKYKYYQANVADYGVLKETVDRIHEDFGSIDGWYDVTKQHITTH